MTVISEKHGTKSPAIQDYVKACYRLGKSTDGMVAMADLAKALHVSAPSVTNMVKRLEALELMRRTKEGKIKLNMRGTALALEVIRHHRLLETFLVEELGMDLAEAHEEAEVLEHYISERFEVLLDKRLSAPQRDPHGEPIPKHDGTIVEENLRSLIDYPANSAVVIREIHSSDPQMLKYLESQSLLPGISVRIDDVAPFHGPFALRIKKQIHYISREAAACVYAVAAP